MNYKNLILIALALCMCIAAPVAAVWQNGNWIADDEVPDVVYDSVTGVSSKYVDTNPSIELENDANSYVGFVRGNLKSGQAAEGGTRFLVSNDLNPNDSHVFNFKSDGLFDDEWVAGNYTVTLPQGTGSAAGIYSEAAGYVGNCHPEVAHVRVVAGQVSYFTFIGNSVPNRGSPAGASINAYFENGDITFDDIKVFTHKWWFITFIDYIEVTVDVNRVNSYVTNPNIEPVDVGVAIDFGYTVDRNEGADRNPVLDDVNEVYTGTLYNVHAGSNHYVLTLVPSIDGAVYSIFTPSGWFGHFDFYPVTINSASVTSTVWA